MNSVDSDAQAEKEERSCESLTSSSTSTTIDGMNVKSTSPLSLHDKSRINNPTCTNETENETAHTEDSFYTPCSSLVICGYADERENEGQAADESSNNNDDEEELIKDEGVRRGGKSPVNYQSRTKPSSLMATESEYEDTNSENDKGEYTSTMSPSLKRSHEHLLSQKSEDEVPLPSQLNLHNNVNHNSMRCTLSPELQSFKTSVSSKASPLQLKSWIALSLTLDGRDKITKVVQYISRLLGFYYETLAASSGSAAAAATTTTTASYVFKAKKFRKLYKALTSSRKAYRFGRTLIEIEKLQSMGFLHWVAWYLRGSMFIHEHHNLVDDEKEAQDVNDENERDNTRYRPQTQESSVSFHPATNFKQRNNGDIPPRIILPRQVSSNIGYKPSSFANNDKKKHFLKQLSTVGRFTYLSLSSFINDDLLVAKKGPDGQQKKLLEKQDSKSPPPLWKILSSAFKIIGLAGFWTADNISYLYSIGFLVDDNDPKKLDLGGKSKQRTKAAIFATRSYFFASLAGLYFNVREWYNHRNGPFLKTVKEMDELKRKLKTFEVLGGNNKAYTEHQYRQELEATEKVMEEVKHKHFKICLALLKVSSCVKKLCLVH